MSYFKIITNRAIFGWTINSSADLKIKIFIFPPLYYFFLISRSLLPISCPVIANPIKSGIASLGVSNQIRKGIINGMEACIITHHMIVIFLNRARYFPRIILILNAETATINIFTLIYFCKPVGGIKLVHI